MGETLTIGELSRRAGISVKTLRFYSEEGLLPPAGRSRSGYRLYTAEHAVRLDLIRALREAGMGLDEIGRVLRREMTLEEALALHLGAVEAHIAALRKIASELRTAIRSGATEEHLRRITMVTRATNEDRRNVIGAFYEKVVDGLPVDPQWVEGMVDASTPVSSDDLSLEQLAAWTELCGFLEDPVFVACKRVSASDRFAPDLQYDVSTLLSAQEIAMVATRDARRRGIQAKSGEAAEIVKRFTSSLATATGKDEAVVAAHMRVKYDPRGARYWELVSLMRGDPAPLQFDDWRWFGEALAHHAEAV